MSEELNYCEDCDKSEEEISLKEYSEREQEYPGAYVWVWKFHLCNSCAKKRPLYIQPPIRENTRGW